MPAPRPTTRAYGPSDYKKVKKQELKGLGAGDSKLILEALPDSLVDFQSLVEEVCTAQPAHGCHDTVVAAAVLRCHSMRCSTWGDQCHDWWPSCVSRSSLTPGYTSRCIGIQLMSNQVCSGTCIDTWLTRGW